MTRSRGFVASLLRSKQSKIIFGGILGIAVIGFVATRVFKNDGDGQKQMASVLGEASQSKNGTIKNFDINQSIEIPTGTPGDSIQYTIINAELRDSIILRGSNATAVDGKQFLILNVKLSNKGEQRVKLNTRDYIRLAITGTEDRLAPSIHNDPVEIQPISDQFTRLGFSVNKQDNGFTLYLGEISEDKTEIPLQF